MTIYDELKARGLIAQVTDEEEIKEVINNGKATFYIGFDCTADSLTAGHFMALTLMKRLQQAGNRPIALIGGGTTMIGDPSGRTDMRKMLTKEDIDHNAECFKRQMERFIEFGEGKALMLNNADWLLDLNYIELLREVGPCFSVNNMLRAECYKQRMEKGLSFLEFNYMIMQSYDFYHLFQNYGCNMEFGGDDQWSNMLGGTELIRRKLGKDAYAMTITLLTVDHLRQLVGQNLLGFVQLLTLPVVHLVDLLQRQEGQHTDALEHIRVADVAPVLVELERARLVGIKPDGVARGLAHLLALGVGQQRDGHGVGILAQLAAD